MIGKWRSRIPAALLLVSGSALTFVPAGSAHAGACDEALVEYNTLSTQYNKTVDLRKAAKGNVVKSCAYLETMLSVNTDLIAALSKTDRHCRKTKGGSTSAELEKKSAALRRSINDECTSTTASCSQRLPRLWDNWTARFATHAEFDYGKASKSEVCKERTSIEATLIEAGGALSGVETDCAEFLKGQDAGIEAGKSIIVLITDMVENARTLKDLTSASCD